jgi:hypothetical protein
MKELSGALVRLPEVEELLVIGFVVVVSRTDRLASVASFAI